MTTDELIAALAAYDFRDPHGHPLTGCKEWRELVRMVKGEYAEKVEDQEGRG